MKVRVVRGQSQPYTTVYANGRSLFAPPAGVGVVHEIPREMRAVVFHAHGGLDVLRIGKMPTPEPGPGEVLVNVKASGLNHLDVHTRRGLPNFTLPMPHIPGCDGAGVVVAQGAGVTTPALGTRVAINPMLCCMKCEFCVAGEHSLCPKIRMLGEHTRGTNAEYVAVPWTHALPMPDTMDFATAAAAPVVYQTAWRMLKRARLAPGEDILIIGASGGVGSAAVQIAKLWGARVLATAGTPEKAERAKALGADIVLDSDPSTLAKKVREITAKRGVDVVADHVGRDVYGAAVRALRRGGRYVTCGATTGNDPPAELHYVFWNQLEVIGSTMASLSETRAVMRLVFDGTLKPVVDSVLPLDQVAEGHRRIEERRHFGKIVLDV